MSKENQNANEEFELFGTPAEDNLKELLAKGAYKWTNKATGVLAIFLIVVASASAGAWYGHRQASNSSSTLGSGRAFSNFRAAGGFAGFSGGAPSGASASAAAGFSGGGFGGRGVSGTVDSVKGNTITVTVSNLSATNLASTKAGDKVTVRASNGAAGFGGGNFAGTGNTGNNTAAPLVAPSGAPSPGTKSSRNTSRSASGTTPQGQPTLPAGAAPQGGGQGRGFGGGGGGGGGGFNNPAFTSCLKDNGVTLAPGARPDRSDPKLAAALQACFSKLGIGQPGGGGFGGGNGGGANAPAPTATP